MGLSAWGMAAVHLALEAVFLWLAVDLEAARIATAGGLLGLIFVAILATLGWWMMVIQSHVGVRLVGRPPRFRPVAKLLGLAARGRS